MSSSPSSPSSARRTVQETGHETSQIMMPQHANALGHVFGGVIMSMMDTCAAVSAMRHARMACVTASVDRIDFREPVHVGDLVIMRSSVNFVGRTSMEVGVRVETENLLDGVRRHTNSCYMTFVAVDRNGRPVEVAPIVPETETEKRRFAHAKERRRRRLEERDAERTAEHRIATASAAEAAAAPPSARGR
jgi:acyl-CoA hydrolase